MQSDHPSLNNLWGPKIIIENAIGDPKTTFSRFLDMTEGGEAYVVERRRMRGTFMETLELWHFPFDVQVSLCAWCTVLDVKYIWSL